MAWNLPTNSDFMGRFARDFAYDLDTGSPPALNSPPTDRTKVCIDDLANAFADAATLVNPGLFTAQPEFSTAYLYLVAHFLVLNIKNSTAGLGAANASPWLVQSKGVGPVSVSYGIPQDILQNPVMAQLATTPYGARYLQLVLPLAVGNVGVVAGSTRA